MIDIPYVSTAESLPPLEQLVFIFFGGSWWSGRRHAIGSTWVWRVGDRSSWTKQPAIKFWCPMARAPKEEA